MWASPQRTQKEVYLQPLFARVESLSRPHKLTQNQISLPRPASKDGSFLSHLHRWLRCAPQAQHLSGRAASGGVKIGKSLTQMFVSGLFNLTSF
ncbi:hypothetical protein M8J77_020628 [Diaphorina citri]|nr:hypothetical protein M8J77_020628 [Diaphorina citri]